MEESGGKENENQIGTLVNEITVMIGNPERSKSSPECYINRVPDYLCKVNKEAYTPRIISIGPIHHSTLKLQPMEKYKERFLKSFIDRKEIKTDLENLVNTVWEMEEKISCCYAKTIALSKDDFVKMILMDAIFILELFLINYDIGDNHEESHKIAKSLIAEEEEEAEADEENWMASMLNPPKKLPERKEGTPKLLYSATQLNEAGVKFRKSSRKSLLGIHFDSKRGVLEIPCLTLDDSTEILIRNIIALEQSQGKGYVTDYFAVLDFLIDTAKDIDLLCNEEIVVNYLGDSNAATSVVNKLNTDVIWYDTNSEYLRICEDLNDFYRIPWHRWKATLTHQYFSTPWKAASTIAAIILLVLTLIQSVISIIQVA
nr:uncharacterized protein LOC112001717 isoform X2 [Quercus suber]